MIPSYSAPDLQSFPLTMIVGHILDPDGKDLLKKISGEILHRITQPIIVVDQQGQVVTTNKAFDELCCAGAVPTKNNVCFNEMDFKDEEVTKILDFGIPIMNCRDNMLIDEHTNIPVNVHIYPIFSGNKVRSGAVCLVHDITREVSYNKLLKQSEIILNTINTGVIAVDNSLKITMFNKYAEKSFSFSQRQVIGQPFGDFIGQFIEDKEQVLNALTKQKEIRDRELVFYINNNKHHYICDTYLLKNDVDESDGTIIFLKNITKIKEIELQLARSEKLSIIGELAAGTAHEIRNPLTTVRGFVQVIHQKLRQMGINEFDDQVNLMLAEIDRVNQIITDFLNLAKPKQTQIQLLDINSLLNEVMFLMENEALRQNIKINKVLAPSLPSVVGDKDQLSQVFLNIISNAFQAMGEKGVLTIKSTASDDQSMVIIDLIDNGVGIPKGLLDKVFDPFVSTKEDGTGLGLAISNRIIADHRGEIKVTSLPGAGTTFSVILPAGEI
ncbi:ATP-binding protein [Desulfoscipio geothermicus]|uniref:histidine kinase n=1 Tax=Desulfoscipio geothermicus DSM 3669 TaxID=1121426 RepID=A0A1I6EAF7_9FIRM|nr:ATP-binding protein [Desulfoscipio geothermicus]SFR14561.1 Signal transduction histidine kinase, nitrogen specific [Desulfoscipio geothermicus DSM 3669]